MNKGLITLLGFILFLIGTLALVLNLVGLNLSFLSFLEDLPRIAGFLVKIFILISGLIVMYISRSNPQD